MKLLFLQKKSSIVDVRLGPKYAEYLHALQMKKDMQQEKFVHLYVLYKLNISK